MNNHNDHIVKKKIVAVGLYVPGTGFTRVLTSLFSRLKDHYEIHWLGVGYKGAQQDFGYTLYPTNLNGGDIYAAYQMAELANEIGADAVFLLNDFWMLKNYEKCLKSLKKSAVSIAYVPLDGKIDNPNDIVRSAYLDHIVCYTDFASEQTQIAFAQLLKTDNLLHSPSCHVIPHGTDLEEFFPVAPIESKKLKDDRTALKARFFPEIVNPAESFIILTSNLISERKALHLSLQSFARFAEGKSNVFLCLHLPNSPMDGLEKIEARIRALNIEPKVLLNPLGSQFVNNEQLNLLYNACDVGLNTSYGEGWGMIAFEHAATGSVQIVPNHTACGELWKNNGELISIEEDLRLSSNPFLMSKIDTDHLVEIINILYHDPEYLNIRNKASYDFTQSNKFNWSNVAQQWNLLLEHSIKSKQLNIQEALSYEG